MADLPFTNSSFIRATHSATKSFTSVWVRRALPVTSGFVPGGGQFTPAEVAYLAAQAQSPEPLGAIQIYMVTILFLDDNISKTKTGNAICRMFDLTLFDFTKELRNQLWLTDGLTREMKSFIDEGTLIPTATLEKFVVRHITETKKQEILLSGYPRTSEQFQGLEKLLQTLHLPIYQIWYIRQRDPERFLIEYLQDQKENGWLKKFGDEFISGRKQFFANKRAYIDNIRQVANQYDWKIVDMDYQPNLTEQFITQKLQNSA